MTKRTLALIPEQNDENFVLLFLLLLFYHSYILLLYFRFIKATSVAQIKNLLKLSSV